ncbi:hypothetical protein BDZ91DRAFT_794066 [Kalaharituber pfeilii]|nr:hypothetical protein BDZ91DRAFT_794066 [Kalaharituber pfeilii]
MPHVINGVSQPVQIHHSQEDSRTKLFGLAQEDRQQHSRYWNISQNIKVSKGFPGSFISPYKEDDVSNSVNLSQMPDLMVTIREVLKL